MSLVKRVLYVRKFIIEGDVKVLITSCKEKACARKHTIQIQAKLNLSREREIQGISDGRVKRRSCDDESVTRETCKRLGRQN